LDASVAPRFDFDTSLAVFLRLLILFITVPIIELWILFQLAQWKGFWWTLGLVIVTGVVGSALARAQGIAAYRKIMQQVNRGELPAEALFDGLLIFIAGLLLITPGVLTDLLGLSLLIPFCRSWYRQWIVWWFKRHFRVETFRTDPPGHSGSPGPIIDSYVVGRDEEDSDQHGSDRG
jgi:UPF0716 protein FxsA